MSPTEAAYLRGRRYEAEKIRPGTEASREVKRKAVRARHGDQIDLRAKTEDRLGSELGVSGVTVKPDAAFARGVDMIAEAVSAEAAAKVRSGEVKITKPQVAKIGRAKSPDEARKLYKQIIRPNALALLLKNSVIKLGKTDYPPARPLSRGAGALSPVLLIHGYGRQWRRRGRGFCALGML